MTIRIETKTALLAIRDAYNRRELIAQNTSPDQELYNAYRCEGFPCAIGVLLSDGEAGVFDELGYSDVMELVHDEELEFDDIKTANHFNKLQARHDDWSRAMSDERSNDAERSRRAGEFTGYLNALFTQYVTE